MSELFVQSNQVTNWNGLDFGYPNNTNGIINQIPCEGTQIIGSYWRIPQTLGNRVIGYTYLVDNQTPNPPQADAIKILRVKLINNGGISQVDFAILNTDNIATSSPPNQFAYLCNGTGGTLPVMPTVVIPYPILQTGPVNTANNGTNTFIYSFPSNPQGLTYTLQAVWFNGVAPAGFTPGLVPSGVTTMAEMATYANTNWSTYGTFSALSNTTLQLLSPTSAGTPVSNSGMNIDLTPVNWCFDLTGFGAGTPVTAVQFGAGPILPLTNGPITLTNNPVTLLNALAPMVSSGTIFSTSVAHKLGLNNTMAQPQLYNGVSSVVTASSGACA